MSVFRYIWTVVCDLVRWGDYVSSSIQWWNYFWFVVSIYFPKFLPYLFGLGSGVYKNLCLMALLRCNVLNLVLFIGFHWFFIYSALTIFSFLSHSSFHHATVSLLFVSVDVLGMVFSAAYSMVLTRQLCASSIVFWFCTLVVFCALFLKLRPICTSYAPSLLLFHEDFPFLFYDDEEVITSVEFIFFAQFKFWDYRQAGNF